MSYLLDARCQHQHTRCQHHGCKHQRIHQISGTPLMKPILYSSHNFITTNITRPTPVRYINIAMSYPNNQINTTATLEDSGAGTGPTHHHPHWPTTTNTHPTTIYQHPALLSLCIQCTSIVLCQHFVNFDPFVLKNVRRIYHGQVDSTSWVAIREKPTLFTFIVPVCCPT